MAIISVINQKGGCGKTTTAVNLATGFAKKGFSVLLIDMDPQAHATLGLGINPDKLKKSMFDLLNDDNNKIKFSNIIVKISKRFDVAPANVVLSVLEQALAGKDGRELRLSSVLAKVKNQYDKIVIDCPPSLGLLTINSLLASSHAIVPIDSGFYALAGVAKLEETIAMLRKKTAHQIKVGHLITFYDIKSTFNKDFRRDLADMIGETRLFACKIRRSIKFNISQRIGISVIDMGSKKGGIAYKDYNELVKEIASWTKDVSNYRIRLFKKITKTELRRSGSLKIKQEV